MPLIDLPAVKTVRGLMSDPPKMTRCEVLIFFLKKEWTYRTKLDRQDVGRTSAMLPDKETDVDYKQGK